MSKSLGKYVHELRLKRGMTAREVGRLSGDTVSGQTVLNLEAGLYSPRLDTLDAIGRALGVSLYTMPKGVVLDICEEVES